MPLPNNDFTKSKARLRPIFIVIGTVPKVTFAI